MFNHQNAIGAVLPPFVSWLLMRGMKTLGLRMRRHEENALELAEFLEQEEEIADVLYPGKGGMLSFRLQKEEWVNPFLKALKTICFAESLGGVESFYYIPRDTDAHGHSGRYPYRKRRLQPSAAFFQWALNMQKI
ncbi:PLP-dependent transferase [Bacillus velezensis]|uniref:PLP-dependent transferase n=1 Tax=Bacillus velezensis TaxID=492670 RepID=UPI003CF1C157